MPLTDRRLALRREVNRVIRPLVYWPGPAAGDTACQHESWPP